MNSYVNMGAGALLGTVFVLMSVSIASEGIFHSPVPEKEGFAIVAEENPAEAAGEAGGEAAEVAIGPLLATADADAGQGVFKKCASCHTVEKGGPNKVGPNLWGVVNRPIASHEGFSYSAGMVAFSQGQKVVWDFDHLSYFIEAPKKHVPGTAMGFAGIKKPEERANLLSFLRTQSDSPAPLPDPAAAQAAPAEGVEPAAAPAAAAPATGDAPAQAPVTTQEPKSATTPPGAATTQEPDEAGKSTSAPPSPQGDQPAPAPEQTPAKP